MSSLTVITVNHSDHTAYDVIIIHLSIKFEGSDGKITAVSDVQSTVSLKYSSYDKTFWEECSSNQLVLANKD